MYIVTIENNGVETEIHGHREKLASGNVVKGINTIDSFSFSLFPSNVGFDLLNDFTTLVKVYNTNKQRYEFYGRVLYSTPSMNEKGLITKDVTCESYFGFLCDSQQKYVEEKNWTVTGLLNHIINTHNAQIESYKRFKIGTVNVTDPNDNLYLGIQRENTWNTLTEKLIDKLGGEIRFRVETDGLYLDYLTQIGESKDTPIKLSHNMKSIVKENDPSTYVTRLIPLGGKIDDETEERLDITSVNNGVEYIDDPEAIAKYGLHIGYKEWDDITEPANLLARSKDWIRNNNRVLVKYSITALDLSIIGLDYDDFDVGNRHPIENSLLSIYDTSRVSKKNIDVCDETKSDIEVGDVFKNLSDLEVERAKQAKELSESISSVARGGAGTGKKVAELENQMTDAFIEIDKNTANILLKANATTVEELVETVNGAWIEINGLNAQIIQKAQQTVVDDLGTRVSAAEIKIDGANAEIILKASKDSVDGLANRVSAAEIKIDGANAEILLRAKTTYVDSEITKVKKLVADEIEAIYSDVNYDISESVSTKTLTVNGNGWVSGSLTASELSTGSLTIGGYGIGMTEVTLMTNASIEVRSTGGTVTGVTLNKSRDTFYFLTW